MKATKRKQQKARRSSRKFLKALQMSLAKSASSSSDSELKELANVPETTPPICHGEISADYDDASGDTSQPRDSENGDPSFE